jgi:hypothetical protein
MEILQIDTLKPLSLKIPLNYNEIFLKNLRRPPESPHFDKSGKDKDFVPKHASRERREQSVPLAGLSAS